MERHAIITGGAGFIGSHLVDRLMDEGGWRVTVLDNFHPNYPRATKEGNLARHLHDPHFRLVEGDVLDDEAREAAFNQADGADTVVVHMAALTGVRPSLDDPLGYHRVNTTGSLKMLEHARAKRVRHFILASSSSVYGECPVVPWKEDLGPLHPISPYAASKLAAEEFTRVYAQLHGLDATVLRFFTVYGPRQRPDLAIHDFFKRIALGEPIMQFGDGTTGRDYAYIHDIISGVRGAIDRPMERRSGQGSFEIYNLGNSVVVQLKDLIAAIERQLGRKAIITVMPDQAGDVPRTCADPGKAKAQFGFAPRTTLKEGLAHFAEWFANEAAKRELSRDSS